MSNHELVALIGKLGLHVASLRLGVSAKELRSYAEGLKPVPPELERQCAEVLNDIAGMMDVPWTGR
jgi:hypothetical protein